MSRVRIPPPGKMSCVPIPPRHHDVRQHHPETQRRSKLDCYYTCQVCERIDRFTKWLDDKPICPSCLADVITAAKRKWETLRTR
jgi:hypothetical protein